MSFPVQAYSPQMVLELAARIQEPKEVLARYGISAEQFAAMAKTPQFKAEYREAKAFWESDANVRERIAVKAAVLLEDALLDLHDIMTSKLVAPNHRVDAFKQIAVLAKVNGGEQSGAVGGGGQISIHIDMGARKFNVDKEVNALEGEYEEVDE